MPATIRPTEPFKRRPQVRLPVVRMIASEIIPPTRHATMPHASGAPVSHFTSAGESFRSVVK